MINGIKYRNPEEMKDSTIIGIGLVPIEWNVLQFKYAINSVSNGTTKEQVADGSCLVTRIETISNGEIDFGRTGKVHKFNGINRYKLKYGDILFSHINSLKMIGNIAIYTSSYNLYHGMNLLRIQPTNDSKWLYYFMLSNYFRNTCEKIANPAINQASISTTNLKQIRIVKLPITEQQKIANFLDIKTAQFDYIIAKKELLIQKLEEAKKSLISEVVTGKMKIIDGEMVPRQPEEMKDSGVEWLGMMPKDWRNAHIRYFAVITSGGTPNRNKIEYWENGDIPWLNSGEINKEIINYSTNFITKAGYMNSNAKYLPINTVLIALNGQGATKGKVALLKCKATCNQSLGAFVCNEKNLIPEYLFFQLKAKYSDLRGLVGENREGLSINLLKRTYILIPSIDEQKFIVEFLVYKTNQIDQILSKEMIQISKLKSAKQSLISEAVTGKIDLRDWEIIEEGEVQ